MEIHPDQIEVFDTNPEWKNAWELIHNQNSSVNLCGKAGTGKSTFLRAIGQYSSKKAIFTAPTGIAALNIRGVTLHSFFGLPFGPLLMDDPRMLRHVVSPKKKKIIEKMELLVIDEISMVRADILDAIDSILKKTCRNALPFGGKQLLLVGDNFQLEPVVRNDELAILNLHYEHAYYFASKAFYTAQCQVVELKIIYRQTDSYFISLLNKVRIGGVNVSDLDELNSRMLAATAISANDQSFSIILATRTSIVASENLLRLASLKSEQYNFKATIEGKYNNNTLPTDEILSLKVDAQIIMVRNDANKRWVNGSLGKIVDIKESVLSVLLESGKTVKVEREKWDQIEYVYDSKTGAITENVLGSFTQYPLKLAWAITIHKSQGLTFNRVILNMEGGAFAAGQLYVALSRCRTFEGLTLLHRIKPTDVIVKREALEFAGLGKYIENFNHEVDE